jgi:hypothetical protein
MTRAAQFAAGVIRFALGVLGALARLAGHHPLAAIITLVLLGVFFLFWKAVLGRHPAGGGGPGRSGSGCGCGCGPARGSRRCVSCGCAGARLAALSYGRRSRQGLSLPARLTRPSAEFAARLGRAQYGRRLYAAFELHRLVLAPPRTDKTGLLADWIIRHPGPVLTTSTRADLHRLTSPLRRGRVDVFNPEGIGDVPSTFAWDLLGVCTGELVAYKMADWLAGATPGYGDLAWFEEQGTMGMSGLLLAAAKTGATLAEVYQWVQRRGHERALAVLAAHGNGRILKEWAGGWGEARSRAAIGPPG